MDQPIESRPTAVARGQAAEALAESHLATLGYHTIVRNHRCRGGEIDLVAWDGPVLCIIEVRARSTADHGHPLETIDARKIARIARATRHLLALWPEPWPQVRFDALGILLTEPPVFELVRAAFEVG